MNRQIIVKTEFKEIDSKSNPLLYKQTWPIRRKIFQQNRNQIKKPIKKTIFVDWLNEVKASDYPNHLTVIDGHALHSAIVTFYQRRINFDIFRDNLTNTLLPIHYFSLRNDSEKLLHFFRRLSLCKNYNVTVRDRKIWNNIYNPGGENEAEIRIGTISVALPMSLEILSHVLDNEKLKHILLITRDPEMLDTIRMIQEYDLKVAIVYNGNLPISYELLEASDYCIDIEEMFTYLDAYMR